ncbi:heavy-metal-associated domain-containing protein [Neobacillus sp. OS1-2]|uniref:heavy-metal-associated domain-containing protein n=1 Tax=Neobacillus sp. OS1-2 TaxID=3070680 RepID=UPI0027E0862F|nr:heavy-metal-associated domain-containing protein [Neobacillus sp. OS1-2]WML38857.1 heavy-metal-associated domain-containing protein [Neobacillus sp. OS1-2]
MKTIKLHLEDLTCPSCIKKIERALLNTKGVEGAQVLFNSSKVKVVFDESIIESTSLKDVIEKLGYQVLSTNETNGR